MEERNIFVYILPGKFQDVVTWYALAKQTLFFIKRYKLDDKKHRHEVLDHIRTTRCDRVYKTVNDMITGFESETKNSEQKVAATANKIKSDLKEVGFSYLGLCDSIG